MEIDFLGFDLLLKPYGRWERFSNPDQKIFAGVAKMLGVARERDKVWSQLEAINPDEFRSDFYFFEQGKKSPRVDTSKEEVVWNTTRDGWSKSVRAPRIVGLRKWGMPYIAIEPTFDASTGYDLTVLPGIDTIILGPDRRITAITRRGERRELTRAERSDLVVRLKEVNVRAQEVLRLNNETLGRLSVKEQEPS